MKSHLTLSKAALLSTCRTTAAPSRSKRLASSARRMVLSRICLPSPMYATCDRPTSFSTAGRSASWIAFVMMRYSAGVIAIGR